MTNLLLKSPQIFVKIYNFKIILSNDTLEARF